MIRRWVLILNFLLLAACNTDMQSANPNSSSSTSTFSQTVFSNTVPATTISNCYDYASGTNVNMSASWDPSTKSMLLLRPGDKLEASYKSAVSAIYLYSLGQIVNGIYSSYELMHDSTGKSIVAVQMNLAVNCTATGDSFYDSSFLNSFGQTFRSYYLIPPACSGTLKSAGDIKMIDFLTQKIRCTI